MKRKCKGCERIITLTANGFCVRCYRLSEKGLSIEEIRKVPLPIKKERIRVCKGCDRKTLISGYDLCSRCYRLLTKRGLSIEEIRKIPVKTQHVHKTSQTPKPKPKLPERIERGMGVNKQILEDREKLSKEIEQLLEQKNQLLKSIIQPSTLLHEHYQLKGHIAAMLDFVHGKLTSEQFLNYLKGEGYDV